MSQELLQESLDAILEARRSYLESDSRAHQGYLLNIIEKLQAALARPEIDQHSVVRAQLNSALADRVVDRMDDDALVGYAVERLTVAYEEMSDADFIKEIVDHAPDLLDHSEAVTAFVASQENVHPHLRWEVQHSTLCDGWVNTWTDDDETPVTYASKSEAEQAFKEYLEYQHRAVDDGDWDEKYDPADFRVVFVIGEPNTETPPKNIVREKP